MSLILNLNKVLSLLVFSLVLSVGLDARLHAAVPETTRNPGTALIIISEGDAYKTITALTDKDLDAVAMPTSRETNCRTLATELQTGLTKLGYKVRIAITSDVKTRDILENGVVIFVSSVHFWNISWDMKRLFDFSLKDIYVSGRNAFRTGIYGALTVCEASTAGLLALDAIRYAVSDCDSQLAAAVVVENRSSSHQEAINELLEALPNRNLQ